MLSCTFFGAFILVFCLKNQASYQSPKLKDQWKKLTCTSLCLSFPPSGKRSYKLLNCFGMHRRAELDTKKSLVLSKANKIVSPGCGFVLQCLLYLIFVLQNHLW